MLLPLLCLLAAAPASADERPDSTRVVTAQDAERLRQSLEYLALTTRDQRIISGFALIGLGTLGGGLGLGAARQLADPETRLLTTELSLVEGGSMVAGGVVTMLLRSEQEAIYEDYLRLDRSTDEARTRAVETTERRLQALSVQFAQARPLNGWTLVALGAGASLLGVYGLVFDRTPQSAFKLAGPGFTAAGLVLVADGIFFLTVYRSPIERFWELYQGAAKARRDGVKLDNVGVGPAPGGGWMAGLSGRF